jgi:hypothetical protein
VYLFGRRAYSKMCGCRDCNNCPHSRTGTRRDEQNQWRKDFEDEEIYPELEDNGDDSVS